MDFAVPNSDLRFAIPDNWWHFCELRDFHPQSEFFPYTRASTSAYAVPISQIDPPQRDGGMPPFKKYKMVPVLLAFTSPECQIPPVHVERASAERHAYRVPNSYDRFYASIAVGYSKLPILVKE